MYYRTSTGELYSTTKDDSGREVVSNWYKNQWFTLGTYNTKDIINCMNKGTLKPLQPQQAEQLKQKLSTESK